MTTLYRPVLIETAEQAEALHVGTIAHVDERGIMNYARKVEGWGVQSWRLRTEELEHADMVGWTALVPIEAEEEWALIYDGEDPTPCADEADAREWAHIDGEGRAPSRRYITPWIPKEQA